ncbi:MAG TPA: pyridoxal phosphate-dependent aminotransferase [Planctomycetota bacterium]|nr:pyridoxal phosphate-dependent aminotransferase [Planctomycetota bacterium]
MTPRQAATPPALAGRTREVCESVTLAIAERAATLRAQGVDLVSFAAGEPDFDTPDFIKKAAIDALAKGYTKYTPSSGIPALRAAIADKLRRDQGLSFEPSQVLVSCGAKHSIYNAIHAILDPGDEAIVSSPYWTSYPEMVKTADARPVIVPTTEKSGFKLDPGRLEEALTPRTKLLIHGSPVNPTGGVYTKDELEGLARVVVERGLYVISDEVYEKMVYGSTPHVSIGSLGAAMAERTVVVNSCSKTYSMTGWRIGYAAGPRDLIDGAARIQSQATSNPTSIAQYAALAAFQGDQSFLAGWVAEYKRRRDAIVKLLRAIPGFSVVEPEGAFYAFPRVSGLYGRTCKGRALRNSVDVAEFLLDEARIAVVPGAGFGSDDHIRISYATSMEKITEGMRRLAKAIRELD